MMLDLIRRLFRRPVRHVVDLPAYAGWGPTGITPAPTTPKRRMEDIVESLHGPLNPRTRTYADGTSHLGFLAGHIKGHRPTLAIPTPEEVERGRCKGEIDEVRVAVSAGMACPKPAMAIRIRLPEES